MQLIHIENTKTFRDEIASTSLDMRCSLNFYCQWYCDDHPKWRFFVFSGATKNPQIHESSVHVISVLTKCSKIESFICTVSFRTSKYCNPVTQDRTKRFRERISSCTLYVYINNCNGKTMIFSESVSVYNANDTANQTRKRNCFIKFPFFKDKLSILSNSRIR